MWTPSCQICGSHLYFAFFFSPLQQECVRIPSMDMLHPNIVPPNAQDRACAFAWTNPFPTSPSFPKSPSFSSFSSTTQLCHPCLCLSLLSRKLTPTRQKLPIFFITCKVFFVCCMFHVLHCLLYKCPSKTSPHILHASFICVIPYPQVAPLSNVVCPSTTSSLGRCTLKATSYESD